MPGSGKGLLERLHDGGVICAEGYLFEFEERGYLKAGGFVPEVVLEHPELVRQMHQEFVHAGSDIVEAFTYYGHRHKMRLIGREDEVEQLNRSALRIARQVADETGTLMAGNIPNSTIFKPNDPQLHNEIYAMFEEQVKWAVEEGADFIIGETYMNYEEAVLGLKAIKEFGKGLPAVIMFHVSRHGLLDGVPIGKACRQLEEQGADVVGLNCARGPATMLPLLREVRQACKGPIAALPVPYRTTPDEPSFQGLEDIVTPGKKAFYADLDAYLCSRTQIAQFSREAWDLGVRFLGLCCGSRSHYIRSMAESIGRRPPASRYSPDMSIHYSRMTDERHTYTHDTFQELYADKHQTTAQA